MANTIQSPTSDQVWEAWKYQNAKDKKFQKLYREKGLDFDINRVAAAEYVKEVEKGVLIFFRASKSSEISVKNKEKSTISAKKIEKIQFFEFHAGNIDKSEWKYDENVPVFSTLEQNQCSKCQGDGGIKCSKCQGTGQIKCEACKDGKEECKDCSGSGDIEINFKVIDEKGKKNKEFIKIKCKTCFGSGKFPCRKCNSNKLVLCKSCNGMGGSACEYCDGHGKEFVYQIHPVPFQNVQSTEGNLYTNLKLQSSIETIMKKTLNKSVEDLGNVPIKNPDDLNKKFLNTTLGYLDKKIWKLVTKSKKEIENLEKEEHVKILKPIFLLPIQILKCSTKKRKDYSIYALGTNEKFQVFGEF